MSRQHLELTAQFPSQGMGWIGRRFIHFSSESKMYGWRFALATLWYKVEDYQHFVFIMKIKDIHFSIYNKVQIAPNIMKYIFF